MKAMLRSGCLAAALFLFTHFATGQTVPAQLNSRLNRTLDSMRGIVGAKSLSAAIQLSDGAVWAHADGISAVNPTVNVTPQDAYLVGSVTKTITSACVLQLAQQGRLHLDDSLHSWLDTMNYINPDITIRQLLQHTSGLFDVLAHPHNQDSLMADMSRIWTPEELVSRFMAPPLSQPGTTWAYCNTNYFLLSMIIKKATGNPFYTEIRNRFFTPMGLGTFAIPAFEPLNAPVAHVWMDLDGDNVLDDAHNFYFNYLSLNSTAGAAGGYYATPSDCTRWMRSYMRGDVLSAAMMAEAKTTVTAAGAQGGLYGLGLMKNNFIGYEAYGHGGDLAYHASSWYFPARDISITVFTNDNNKDSWKLLPVVRELLRTFVNTPSTAVGTANAGTAAAAAYPSPFSSVLNVDIPAGAANSPITIVLRDALGRTLARREEEASAGKMTHARFEDLSLLPAGIYFAEVWSGDQSLQVIRAVKQ